MESSPNDRDMPNKRTDMNMENESTPAFTLIEGVVLGINEESAANQSMLSRLQESTGFAKDVLSRAEEDVWNGI